MLAIQNKKLFHNKKIFLFVITLLCIASLLYALTPAKLYGALNAFLNGRALEAEISKRIKTLDEKKKREELQNLKML